MDAFEKLIEVANRLNQPDGGCPWDLEQTFESLRPYVLEEAHEALEAIDSGDAAHIIEELGDLLYTVIFYAKVAEREGRFTIRDILEGLTAKLVRRHPHVFGEVKAQSVDEVMQTWEKVKKEEKKSRKGPLEGIPKTLPSLQRAAKVTSRMHQMGYTPPERAGEGKADHFAGQIYALVQEAVREGLDVESAFRTLLAKEEQIFHETVVDLN